ncbi:MAG TPA: alpha/beta hydrolase domain-containing protein [Candidatus Binatia bacterium]|nr:alpha/beta hydrolase domain-containing protein [Candidatus Binatia bacterium]
MITRIVVQRKAIFAGGYEFPITGAYEKIVGKVYGEVDPKNRLNKVIVNLDKAPRNKRGRVEYWSDFCILKPVDMARGNGKIFYDAPNRGGKRIVAFLNDAPQSNDPTTIEDAGNGFLMRQGYTIVWCGWQGDLMPQKNWLVMGVPTATNHGEAIVRRVRTEIVVDEKGIKSQPLSGDDRVKSHAAASLNKSLTTLTVRKKSYGRRIPIAEPEWEFAACEKDGRTGREALRPSAQDLYLRSSFKPGHIYEFIYPAKNPLVLGLGFAIVRDLVSFLRYEMTDARGKPNPLATAKQAVPRSRFDRPLYFPPSRGENKRWGNEITAIRYAYGWGRSQSGRFLRDLVYHGFNEDESHRKVFDAIAPHVAGGGRMFLNYEFARPVTSSQQHTNQLEPELFPHAYNILKDAQTGRRDGILKRPKTDPYVFHTQTSTEYWQKRGCLAHTDGRGRDVTPPDKVRIYVIASAQHNSPFGSEPVKDDTQQPVNPLPAGDVLRALMVALDLWVTRGISPPPSRYPRVSDGTLVRPDRKFTGFPKIPGVRYQGLHNRQLFLDYGRNILRGRMDLHPPSQIGNGAYTILVPKVDADGNDLAGIRLPAVQVPIGTYTGWNLQPRRLAEDELSGLLGSFIPFAKTKAGRNKERDPRLSLQERYKNHYDYVTKVSRAARILVDQRYLLPEDAERMVHEAKRRRIL